MKKQLAFTLIELMITVAIVAIVLAIGLPSMQTYLKNSELINVSNRFSRLTSYAQSEAVKRNHQVIICTSNNNHGCANSGKYLIVVSDVNNNGSADNAEPMLRMVDVVTRGNNIFVNYRNFSSDLVVFTPSGAPTETGTIEICDDLGKTYAKALALNMGGQLRRFSDSERDNIEC